MMTLDKAGNYEPWVQPRYGYDAQDNKVNPPNGYSIVEEGEIIKPKDLHYDVYSGWNMESDGWHAKNKCYTRSEGRWTTYARKI